MSRKPSERKRKFEVVKIEVACVAEGVSFVVVEGNSEAVDVVEDI